MNKRTPKVLIAIVSYNGLKHTVRCLDSLKKLKYCNYEILLIDNGSTDGTSDEVETKCQKVTLIQLKKNTGATGGRNTAIEYALKSDCEYVFFLDNDTFVDENALTALVDLAESDETIAAVGTKAYYYEEKNRIWYFGSHINWFCGSFVDSKQGEIDSGQLEQIREIDTFPIGFGIVRTDVIRRIGKIDDDYFIYYEESDWQMRMKRLGYKLFVTPKAKIWHNFSSSLGGETPRFYYYRNRNRLLFMWKNAPKINFPIFLIYFTFDFLYKTILTLYLSKKPIQLKASVMGVFDFFRGAWGERQLELFG